jgi:F-type H+-transporting ATPase subunit gamma
MPSTQEITRRIKSVKSTRKVTKAMQMVSAAKMRKSQQAALASRKYLEEAEGMMASIANNSNLSLRGASALASDAAISISNDEIASSQSFLAMTGNSGILENKSLIIMISSNRGLVGSMNSNLFAKLPEVELATRNSGLATKYDFIVMGKKASDASKRLGKNIIADFSKPEGHTQIQDIYPIAELVESKIASGEYQEVLVVYNHFVSTLSQQVRIKKLFSFNSGLQLTTYNLSLESDYLFEPSREEVLNQLRPRILENQIYQCLLESDASEHSARMVMMKNATDAAGDLVADLTLTANQRRQSKITTELSEITAGKLALETQ